MRVSSKVGPEKMINDDISLSDFHPFEMPSLEEVERANIEGIHLGEYIFWDGERQTEFLKKEYDWKEGDVEGTYKGYKSCECKMPGVHDYAKYLKRGFGRATDHACQDIRVGLLTREEGFGLINEFDAKTPKALDEYLEITGIEKEEFHKVLKDLRTGKAKSIED